MRAIKIHPKSDNAKTENFIRKNFHQRECIRFSATESDVRACRCNKVKNNHKPTESSTPDSPSADAANLPVAESICKCGYSQSTHSKKAVGTEQSGDASRPWKIDDDTTTSPTNAYGRIQFDYKPFKKSAVKQFIRLDHKDDPVQVNELFSNYWDMKDPKMFMSIISGNQKKEKKREMEEFCETLVETATQKKAWIITDGAMEGIAGMIGGKIDKSFNKNCKTPNVVLGICNWGCVGDKHRLIKNDEQTNHLVTHSICDECVGRCEAKEVSLDRNHTTYLLVDDGCQFRPGCEKTFRGKLEWMLRTYKCKEDDECFSADCIPFVYFLVGGDNNDMKSVVQAIKDDIPVIVAKGTGGAADQIVEIVQEKNSQMEKDVKLAAADRDCLIKGWKRKLLVLFDCSPKQGDSQDLSLYILKALKGLVNKNSASSAFLLAADWDHEVFFIDLLKEDPKESILEDVLYTMLLKEKCSFVEILLSHGVKLTEVAKNIRKLKDTGDMEEEIVKHLTEEQMQSTEVERRRCACKFLCMWSAYRGNAEMANVFWREGGNYLAMALMAYKVSRDRKKKCTDTEEAIAMKDKQNKFQALATGFLSTCDADNRLNTIALLRGKVPDLIDKTPMQIAFDSAFKEFVAQPSFQKLLDKIWTKRIIDYNKTFYFPLMASIFCPFAAATLFKYEKDEEHKEVCITYDKDEEHKEVCIKYDKDEEHKENLDDNYNPTMKQVQQSESFCRRVSNFLDAPVIKFIYNTLTYLAYLVLFSIVMLTDFQVNMSPSEFALMIWTFILIIEECIQVVIFKNEYRNIWNLLDVLALVLYVLGLILRLIHSSVCLECLYVARIVLCLSLLLSVSRVLQMLSIHATLGPKIYMIARLLTDMLSFMLIITIFISAYGVVSNAILYPNQPLNAKLLQDVFYDAWWSLLQEFNTDDALGLNCNMDAPSPNVSVDYCSSSTDPYVDYVACKERRCPANTWLVSVLLAFYALFMVIMMLNVLIAMFNVTFKKVERKQHRISKMERYRIIREYHFRPPIPAPLCVFVYLKNIRCCFGLCKCCGCTEAKERECLESSQNIFSKRLDSKVTDWEESMLEEYEEKNRYLRENTIATIVPAFEDDDRGSEYNVILNNPSYVNKQIKYTLYEIDSLLSKHFHIYTDRKEKDQNGGGNDERGTSSTHDGDSQGSKSSPPSSRTTSASRPSSSKRHFFTDASTQTDKRHFTKETYGTLDTSLGCIYKDCCYEMNIRQDGQPRRGRRTKQKSIAVKAYPGRRHLKKTTCSRNSGCKMVINCKDGKVVKLKTPFGEYGVPPKSSAFPAYRLPVENIRKIQCKCKNLSEGSVRDKGSTSDKKEVRIRMPYGGVVIPPKDGDEKQILFNHKYHRGRSAPVTLIRSPPQAESVKQKDINKSMRPIGETLTFLPSTITNPEVSRGASPHRRRQVEDNK